MFEWTHLKHTTNSNKSALAAKLQYWHYILTVPTWTLLCSECGLLCSVSIHMLLMAIKVVFKRPKSRHDFLWLMLHAELSGFSSGYRGCHVYSCLKNNNHIEHWHTAILNKIKSWGVTPAKLMWGGHRILVPCKPSRACIALNLTVSPVTVFDGVAYQLH